MDRRMRGREGGGLTQGWPASNKWMQSGLMATVMGWS